MTKILCLLTVVVFAFSACKKDTGPDPIAGFSVNPYDLDSDMSTIRVAVYDDFPLINNSENAESFLWDFGDGTTSTDENPNALYTTAGTYTIKLTASSVKGKKTVVSKTVKVLSYVAKQILVTSLNPESALGFTSTSKYPTGNELNVWVEILRAAPDQPYSADIPLFYKTSVAKYSVGDKMPLSFDISDRLVIDMRLLSKCCGYSGLGYIYNLYAQDNTGTYMLSSSYGSGLGFTFNADIRQNWFKITTGFYGSLLSINGDYQ